MSDPTAVAPNLECPMGDGIVTEGVLDVYGFTWHPECYDEEASVGTAPPRLGTEIDD